MATTEERLAALEAKMAQLTDTTPTTYYTHQYSGEEIDNAVGRAVSGGALDTSVNNVSNQLGTFVRPNLLDNGYFGRPVNQRGQTEYTGNGYTVDRWRIINGAAATLQGGALNISYTVAGWNLTTFLDNVLIPGATYTLSCLYKATGLPIRLVCSWGAGKYFFNEQAPISDDWALAEITGTIPTDASIDVNQIVVQSLNSGAGNFSLKAIKLELGHTQTLAHREGDKWVLNEIPDYGEQLRRCQRYCRVYKAGESLPCLAYAESDGWYLSASMYIGNMRTKPINNLGSGLSCSVRNIDSDTLFDKTMLNWGTVGSTMQRLRISGGDATPGTFPYNVMPKQDLIFSADL